jgi:hypothetical protein
MQDVRSQPDNGTDKTVTPYVCPTVKSPATLWRRLKSFRTSATRIDAHRPIVLRPSAAD